MIPYACQILNQMMNESLKKKILVCLLIPLGWIYMSVLMLRRELQARKGREVIIFFRTIT